MINRTITIILVFLFIQGSAQNLSVSSFKILDTDLTANTAGTMEQDQNGETAALIKVVTTQTGFTFDGGALGIVKTKQTPGEVWVYIPRGAKKALYLEAIKYYDKAKELVPNMLQIKAEADSK